MDTFAPPENPHYPVSLSPQMGVVSDRFDSGAKASRAAWARPLRRWRLVWRGALLATKQYVLGFWRRQGGGGTAFGWPLPIPGLYDEPPAVGPTCTTVVSGALAGRTYDVAYTWGNANGETEASPVVQKIVAANSVLVVDPGEAFPRDATFAAVYVSVTGGTLKRQAQINTSGGTWQEPDGGLTAGAAPNTTNAMAATVAVAFAAEPTAELRAGQRVWDISADFEERSVT